MDATAKDKAVAARHDKFDPLRDLKLDHEKSRLHFLARVADEKSEQFKYKNGSEKSMAKARRRAVKHIKECCRKKGVRMPDKFSLG